jgi:hypothetical protein
MRLRKTDRKALRIFNRKRRKELRILNRKTALNTGAARTLESIMSAGCIASIYELCDSAAKIFYKIIDKVVKNNYSVKQNGGNKYD